MRASICFQKVARDARIVTAFLWFNATKFYTGLALWHLIFCCKNECVMGEGGEKESYQEASDLFVFSWDSIFCLRSLLPTQSCMNHHGEQQIQWVDLHFLRLVKGKKNPSINTEKSSLLVSCALTTPLLQKTSNFWKPALHYAMQAVLLIKRKGFLQPKRLWAHRRELCWVLDKQSL